MEQVTNFFNRCLAGVDATLGWHICFGNNQGRPFGERSCREMIPAALGARADVFLEFANRGLAELELCAEAARERDVAVGVIDVKLYSRESPADVAEALRAALRYIPPDRLWATADCGFFATPRWLARQKLESLVQGAAIVRQEIGG
ncbi:MAG TPA: methionine synthase, partial [Dehalococcoidia bacterium]|nr:methionine synthase [Dehalococcoidia bacterium]